MPHNPAGPPRQVGKNTPEAAVIGGGAGAEISPADLLNNGQPRQADLIGGNAGPGSSGAPIPNVSPPAGLNFDTPTIDSGQSLPSIPGPVRQMLQESPRAELLQQAISSGDDAKLGITLTRLRELIDAFNSGQPVDGALFRLDTALGITEI